MIRHHTLALAVLVALSACQSADPHRDDYPADGDTNSPRSTLWLGIPEPKPELDESSVSLVTKVGNGSAVVLDDDLLLTAMHVWSNEAEIVGDPKEIQHFLGLQRDPQVERNTRPDSHFNLRLAGTAMIEAVARLQSSGYEPEFGLVQDRRSTYESLQESRDQIGQDWAVARVDEPWWPKEQIAVLHRPALEPDWSPGENETIYALGFASFFGAEGAQYKSLLHLNQFVSAGPYTVAGFGLGPERAGFMNYPNARPIPKGHSGGGIYVWNAELGRMELVGILSACLEFRRPRVLRPLGLFGTNALSFELPSAFKTREKLVVFVPLARIFEGLSDELRAEIMSANSPEL